jgi:hypothetical protein
MKWLALAVLATVSPTHFELSPHDALRVAEAIGDYDGYIPSKTDVEYEFTDPPGHPVRKGFITIQLRNGAQTGYEFSINKRTGKVFDFVRCLVFEYPVIKKIEHELRVGQVGGASDANTMGDIGCVHYRVLKRHGEY